MSTTDFRIGIYSNVYAQYAMNIHARVSQIPGHFPVAMNQSLVLSRIPSPLMRLTVLY